MSKSNKLKKVRFDFAFDFDCIIPSGFDGYSGNDVNHKTVKKQKKAKKDLQDILVDANKESIKKLGIFPANGKVFVFIIQFFASRKDYESQDVDNTAKTVMDIIKEMGIVKDDGQVKILLSTKHIEEKVGGDFFYCGIKRIREDSYGDMVKACNIDEIIKQYIETMRGAEIV